jgi:5-methylcytosine-specific restriction enzyme subunit McrC
LTEYETSIVSRVDLPEPLAQKVWKDYGKKVTVESPPFQENTDWRITPLGWVGWIPLDPQLVLHLRPKVRLSNLFGMLEYAYRLKGFEVLRGLVDSGSLAEFYQSLARVLASRVIDRARRGLYRDYVPKRDDLPYLRGRVDLGLALSRPHRVCLPCSFEENTADLADNRILAWSLYIVLLSGQCKDETEVVVRRAFLALRGQVSLSSFSPEQCLQRLYNRLNADYLQLHALCRFFLESSGPTHEQGERHALPFLIDMAHLFELFVAEWLKAHLPADLRLDIQDSIQPGEEHAFRFVVDLSLVEPLTGRCLAVLDTKYKKDSAPSPDDVAQVVTYALAKEAKTVILVYPSPIEFPFRAEIGGISVRTMSFGIDSDLEAAGSDFLRQVLNAVNDSGVLESKTGHLEIS